MIERMVARGRGAQGAAARRPLRAALRRERRALPRRRASKFVFHAGMGHVPTDVAPDVRSRTYTIEADVRIDGAATEGVLIAHGDMTCGYSLYIKDGRLVHDMNIGGVPSDRASDRPVPAGAHRLGVQRALRRKEPPAKGSRTGGHPADRRRAGRRLRDPDRLHQLHLLVGPRHRPRPRQPGVALRGAVRLHRQAAQVTVSWTTTRRSTARVGAAEMARQ